MEATTANVSLLRQEKASVTENKEILLEITKENRKNRNNRLKTKGRVTNCVLEYGRRNGSGIKN